jgi:hypothetical protein
VNARRPPTLLIRYELERDRALIVLLADTHEDELRLRLWLRSSTALRLLPRLLARLLDELDRIDEEDAA